MTSYERAIPSLQQPKSLSEDSSTQSVVFPPNISHLVHHSLVLASPNLLYLLPTREPGCFPSRRSDWPTPDIHLILCQETKGYINLEVQSPGTYCFRGESGRGGGRWQGYLGGLSRETRGELEGAQGSNDFGGEAVSAFRPIYCLAALTEHHDV